MNAFSSGALPAPSRRGSYRSGTTTLRGVRTTAKYSLTLDIRTLPTSIRTHARTHTRTQARTHVRTHTRTQIMRIGEAITSFKTKFEENSLCGKSISNPISGPNFTGPQSPKSNSGRCAPLSNPQKSKWYIPDILNVHRSNIARVSGWIDW